MVFLFYCFFPPYGWCVILKSKLCKRYSFICTAVQNRAKRDGQLHTATQKYLVDHSGQRRMIRLVWNHRKITITQIINCGEQQTNSESTTWWPLKLMGYNSSRPHQLPSSVFNQEQESESRLLEPVQLKTEKKIHWSFLICPGSLSVIQII